MDLADSSFISICIAKNSEFIKFLGPCAIQCKDQTFCRTMALKKTNSLFGSFPVRVKEFGDCNVSNADLPTLTADPKRCVFYIHSQLTLPEPVQSAVHHRNVFF